MNKDDSFCSDIDSFKNLLRVDKNITVDENCIIYRDNTVFDFHFYTNDIPDKNERFFDLRIQCREEKDIDLFNSLLRDVRTVCNRTKGSLNILWDDTSLYYSQRAYPLIHETENLLRKLITKFMLTTIGSNWSSSLIPEEVKNAANKQNKKRSENNPLFDIDFITLSEFLFKPYYTVSIEGLLEEIKNLKTSESLDAEKLKLYLPRSNWEKYFSAIVSCEDDYLRKRWNNLYELRCQIAHNTHLNHADFKEVERITSELKIVFNKAIKSLETIKFTKEEKIEIAESIIQNSEYHKKIINYNWNQTIEAVKKLYNHHHPDSVENISTRTMVRTLSKSGILSENFTNSYINLVNLKVEIQSKIATKKEIDILNESIKSFGLNYIFLEEPFISLNIDAYYIGN